MAGSDTDDSLSAAEAFALVGHEVRAEILRVLGDARDPGGPPAVVSFSTLRRRARVDVGSSKFNYHLQELDGEFVERTEEGWRLRHAGTTLYRTIRARAHGRGRHRGPHEIGVDCHHCGGAIVATYDDWGYALECSSCDYVYDWTLVPPGVATGSDAELWDRLDAYVRHRRRAFVRGVCPICANGLETELIDPSEAAYPRTDLRAVVVNRYCDHCTNLRYLTVGEAVRFHPAVTDFFGELGVDVRETSLWELAFAVTDASTTVVSRDPWEVALALECDGGTLDLTIDGGLTVTASDVS